MKNIYLVWSWREAGDFTTCGVFCRVHPSRCTFKHSMPMSLDEKCSFLRVFSEIRHFENNVNDKSIFSPFLPPLIEYIFAFFLRLLPYRIDFFGFIN